ncbi:MAG: response regulator transcription factor [Xanthobacteraceae bacterium]
MGNSRECQRVGKTRKRLLHGSAKSWALVVQGFSNREIAQRLGIAEGTVKFQLHRIYERLGVRNRVALAALIFTDRAN